MVVVRAQSTSLVHIGRHKNVEVRGIGCSHSRHWRARPCGSSEVQLALEIAQTYIRTGRPSPQRCLDTDRHLSFAVRKASKASYSPAGPRSGQLKRWSDSGLSQALYIQRASPSIFGHGSQRQWQLYRAFTQFTLYLEVGLLSSQFSRVPLSSYEHLLTSCQEW